MKAILFLSFFMLFVDVTFSIPYETAENIDTAFQAINDDDDTGKSEVAEDPTERMFQAVDDGKAEASDLETAMDVDDEIEKDDKNLNSQDIHLKLTPGKDIVLTISHSANGGIVYTRWGKMTCRHGAELVYEGYAGGGEHNQKGNGANYLCLPKDPDYLSTTHPAAQSYLYGAEYQSDNKIFSEKTHDYNVPCAVCYVPKKSTKLMIPAKTSCPTSWTREYHGYLMTEHHNHNRNSVYECVDHNPDVIDGSEKNTNGALFYFIEAVCDRGLPCGPYIAKRAITCAVCTK